MEVKPDCECHRFACSEIAGARLKRSKDIFGHIYRMDALRTTIEQCEIKKHYAKKAGELTIRLAEYNMEDETWNENQQE